MSKHNLVTAQFTANTTAQLINPAGLQGARGDIEMRITVLGANTVYYGATNTVTTSNGMPVTNAYPAVIDSSANVYVIAAAGTSVLGVATTY